MRKPLLSSMVLRRVIRRIFIYASLAFIGSIMPLQLYSQFVCDPQIDGLEYVCGGEEAGYMDIGSSQPYPATNKEWTLSGGGTIIGPDVGNAITIRWGNTPGIYSVILNNSLTDPGVECDESDTLMVMVASTQAPQMNCNDTVQLSLDLDCEAVVSPDMILEGNVLPGDAYDVVIRDELGNLIPNATVNEMHVGQYLFATVIHRCSGNSCWGRVFVEDKLPPMLMCMSYELDCDDPIEPSETGPVFFPLKPGYQIEMVVSPTEFIVSGVDACSDVSLTYRDMIVNNTCPPAQEFIQVIYREWTAIDEYGASASCFDTLFIRTGSLDSVTAPPNYDDIERPVLNCADNFKTDQYGNPHPDVTGYPGGDAVCPNIDYDYHDFRIGVCEGSYKIIREWIVADWCEGRSITFDQVIKVLDQEVILVCPPFKTISTNPFTCFGETDLDPPLVIDDCSSWSYYVLTKKFEPGKSPSSIDATDENVIRKPDGSYRVVDLPAGLNWIIYVVEDACGNIEECATEILVEENSKPIPVCDEHTVITLSNNGRAKLYATSIDDGSFDNCGIDRFEIRRMDQGNCPPEVYDSTAFREYAEFCCEDIADNPIMVVMRVYDKSGNFNDCMTFVEVQDENPPTVECLPNLTINCDVDISDLSIFGGYSMTNADRQPIVIDGKNLGRDGLAFDDCGVLIDTSVQYNLNKCGIGTIIRTFSISDLFHSPIICRQFISIRNLDPFPGDQIVWPRDRTFNGCITDLSPDNTGKPDWDDEGYCTDLKFTYKDQIFNVVEGACFKVLRLWTVFDHCVPSGVGRKWEHTQVIKVSNNRAPIFTSSCDNRSFSGLSNNCSGYAELIASAEDDCTPNDQLIWSFAIDLYNDNSLDVFGSTNDASGEYPGGTHRIIFKVEDQCGNENTCSFLFTINDGKKPTPYCATGIITVVMPMTGEVAVWAKDLDAGSFDNCSKAANLRFSFSSNVNNTSRTFRCSDIPNGMEETFEVEVWVTDEFGNQDFCTTKITIQDNIGDACPDTGTVTSALITGEVFTPKNETVENVMVKLNGHGSMYKEHMTSSDGIYAFEQLPMHKKYTLNAERNDNPLNGVSTKDIILIQRHLLGLKEFDSPYKYLAADVDDSEHVSVRDIFEIRRLILGLQDNFPNNKSWRFIDASHQFNNITNPFPIDESLKYDDLDRDMINSDIIAIKIGDISGDVKSKLTGNTNTRSALSMLPILFNDISFNPGDEIKVDLMVSDAFNEIEGLQFALNFDESSLMLKDAHSKSPAVQNSHLGLTNVSQGSIRMSWNAIERDNRLESPDLLSLHFLALKSGKLSEIIWINDNELIPEVYLSDNELKGIELKSIQLNDNLNYKRFVLLQNVPNPFDNSTTIPFSLPEPTFITLRVFSVTGNEIIRIDGYFDKGVNQFTLHRDQLGSNGIYYYQLDSENHTSTKKMILLE